LAPDCLIVIEPDGPGFKAAARAFTMLNRDRG
jgi:hypothetical protein